MTETKGAERGGKGATPSAPGTAAGCAAGAGSDAKVPGGGSSSAGGAGLALTSQVYSKVISSVKMGTFSSSLEA